MQAFYRKACMVLSLALCLGTIGTTYAQDLENLGLSKFKPSEMFKNFKQGDPFRMSGGVGLNLRFYEGFGAPARQSPFTWTLNANTNIGIYKLNIPFSAVLTAQTLDTSNPWTPEAWKENFRNKFVRIGASPYYKWAKLHLGHRSMDFSSLTYTGQTFLGVGTELTPGKLRISAMRGLIPTSEPKDLALFEINQEVYSRQAGVVKVGYGEDGQFVDLVVMKAGDREQVFDIDPDSLLTLPQENLVLGLNTQFTLFEKVSINAELASSSFTNDVLANDADAALDLGDTGASQAQLGKIYAPKFMIDNAETTSSSLAFIGGWKLNGQGFRCGMDYQRYAPGYRTMGAYYFNDDFQNILANVGWTFTKIQVNLDLSGGLQTNNLNNDKPNTVRRVIGSANLNYNLKNFQTNLSYNNFSNRIDYILNPELDSLNAVVISENTAFSASYTLSGKDKRKSSFSFSASAQTVSSPDVNPVAVTDSGSRMHTATLSYNLTPKENGYRWTARLNYNRNAVSGMLLSRYGAGFGVAKSFWEKKINCRLDSNFFTTDNDSVTQQALTSRLSIGIKLNASHSIDLKTSLLRKAGSTTDNRTEMVAGIQYQYRFDVKSEQIKNLFGKKAKETL